MLHTRIFNTHSEYVNNKNTLPSPSLCVCKDNNEIHYNKQSCYWMELMVIKKIEYLECNSRVIKPYIDTGIKINNQSEIYCEFSYNGTNNHAIYGGGNGSSYTGGEVALFYYGSMFEFVTPFTNTTSTVTLQVKDVNVDTKYTTIVNSTSATINGVVYNYHQWYQNYESNRPTYLFATNRGNDTWGGGEHTRIYAFKITENNVIKIDLIPIRIGEIGAMYDKVTGKVLTNSGEGEFIIGPDINIE